MADEEELVEREWIYAGPCRSGSGSVVHCWIDHNGVERLFDKMKANVVAGRFMVECTEEGGRARPSVRYLGSSTDEEQRAELQARARAEGALIERDRLEKSDRRHTEFLEAMAPLKELMKKQRAWDRRSGFIAAVIEELHRS